MQVIMYQANAFADKPFGGNPAGIVPDARDLSYEDMLKIVRLTNLSKVSFVNQVDKDNFEVRFFTSKEEIDFCGYTTIATFYTLANKGYITNISQGVVKVFQHTKIGTNPIEIHFKDWNIEKVGMYHNTPVSLGKYDDVDEISSILSIDKEDIGIDFINIKPEILFTGKYDIIIPVKSRDILNKLQFDSQKVNSNTITRDLERIVEPRFHIFSLEEDDTINCRQFESMSFITECACSGTANAGLIYYLKKNNLIKNSEVLCKQGEQIGRPSQIYCEIINDECEYPIKVGGRGNVFFEGVVTIKD
ncbi:phenazine biosynthesis protein PhzF [Gottschalkia purinilytica]|uniref:Phenazine biosynthesis protein PhzF n=1 Tax=Gottschalkia purinilytica TaxID=1503 RepID=A0A0L0W6Z3_GOTPU|nr:PhzF family phenazine biosynthesis protein [Gottschalkia purinilytica]KNF07284.1 phenazine biosynthesis protein PhzF [Gottschalkia purinilytica]